MKEDEKKEKEKKNKENKEEGTEKERERRKAAMLNVELPESSKEGTMNSTNSGK